MLKNNIQVLMTGGGAPGAYGILQSMREDPSLKIIAADMREECIGKILADDFVQIPKATDNAFIPTLLEICKNKKVDVVFPLVTKELELFSANREAFSAIGTTLIVAEKELLQTVNNKGTLYARLKEEGVQVPDFRIIEDIESFNEAILELGYPNKPVCLKPCKSNGMRGFRILDTQKDTFDLWLNQKPGNAYANLNDIKNIVKNNDCPPLLISEYLPGDEYTVDAFISNEKIQYIIPRLRSKMIGGISVEGKIVQNEQIIEYCKKIIQVFPLDGLFGIQVKYSVDGKPLLLEINPRVQGTTVACKGAGVNLPLLAVYNAINQMPKDFPSIEWNTQFIRHWEEKFL